jgi:hypothetical protein
MPNNTIYRTGEATWMYGQLLPHDWHRYLGPCPQCGSATFDYGGGWRCLAQDCFNSENNPIWSLGPSPKWWDTGIQVVKDGDSWFAHEVNFVNIEVSIVGWGKTPNEAVIDYLREEKKGAKPKEEIIFKAIPLTERVPDTKDSGPQIVVVLMDSRLPMVAMYVGFGNGDDWRSIGDQKPIKEGITHWLQRQ